MNPENNVVNGGVNISEMEQVKQEISRQEAAGDSDLCCICLDAKREAVIMHDNISRSRHKALCIGCAYKIVDTTATCSRCRLPILAVLHYPSSL